MKIKHNEITFSSGKKIYVNNGIVGISPDLKVYEGYDGGLFDMSYTFEGDITNAEAIELANFMISQWKKFKKNILEKEKSHGR